VRCFLPNGAQFQRYFSERCGFRSLLIYYQCSCELVTLSSLLGAIEYMGLESGFCAALSLVSFGCNCIYGVRVRVVYLLAGSIGASLQRLYSFNFYF
jgi:hypothetical protein